ncbi:hypothetical protein ACFVYG_20210 [Streptomyces sp. NPDC058256]|uniref:hypothetical protein n=1 Tax=Streptomyces sp. NPDC058256 TaxID=3346408 RepID=UPI0036E414BA
MSEIIDTCSLENGHRVDTWRTPLWNVLLRLSRSRLVRRWLRTQHPSAGSAPASEDRSFTFLATASVLVTIKGSNELTARAAYALINGEEFSIDFTTRAGHQLHDLTLEHDTPELHEVDGEVPIEPCPRRGCVGYVVNDRCTVAECPATTPEEDGPERADAERDDGTEELYQLLHSNTESWRDLT